MDGSGKTLFGVLMLAMAIWIASPIVPIAVQMLLWAALFIFSAIYLHALDPLPHNAHSWAKLGKGLGILCLLLGATYLIGAMSGACDILRPLGNIVHTSAETPATLNFSHIKTVAELDARIAQTKDKS